MFWTDSISYITNNYRPFEPTCTTLHARARLQSVCCSYSFIETAFSTNDSLLALYDVLSVQGGGSYTFLISGTLGAFGSFGLGASHALVTFSAPLAKAAPLLSKI
jgi:hypothetical protein